MPQPLRLAFLAAVLCGSGVSLTACLSLSSGSTAMADDGEPPGDGRARLAVAPAAPTCLKTCGMEARRGPYADCLEDGGETETCGAAARVAYQGCIEDRCSPAEVALDACRHGCRSAGAAARDACPPGAEATTSQCKTDARMQARTCLLACED